MTEPWNLTEAQRRQFREAHAEAKRRQMAGTGDGEGRDRCDDDFVADRHADLDAGENGGAMTDADYYDRIFGAGQ